MRHWLKDEDLAGVRDPESLSKLPEAERKDWQMLWEEVEALRGKKLAQLPKQAGSRSPMKNQ